MYQLIRRSSKLFLVRRLFLVVRIKKTIKEQFYLNLKKLKI